MFFFCTNITIFSLIMTNNTVQKYANQSFFKLKNITSNWYKSKSTMLILIMGLSKCIDEICYDYDFELCKPSLQCIHNQNPYYESY